MSDVIKMLNTIRENASADYQSTVPVATQQNFLSVGNSILTYTLQNNEFIDALINRVAMTIIQARTFKNPLSVLKKGGVPMGQDIQEIYTNPALGGTYDGNSTELLQTFKADTKVAYYRLNRQAKFRVSVSIPDLQRAFTSIQAFDQFIQSTINSLYNGDEIEQFELTKNLVANAYANNMISEINIYDEATDTSLTDEDIGKRLVKNIKTYSELLTYPSTQYNKFATLKGNGATPIKTWTKKSDQVLILPADVKVNMEVEVLAYAFNVEMQKIDNMTLTLDSFIGQPILGILCDKSCFQIYENLLQMKNFDNGDTLKQTYWLHHWQTYGFSVLANSLAFTYTPAKVTLATGSLGVADSQKITGLTATTHYNLSINGSAATDVTTNSAGEIINLDNKKVYYVTAK